MMPSVQKIKTPKVESFRQVLTIGGFQWSKGSIYLGDGGKLAKISKADERLELPYVGTVLHGVFAIDPDNIFVTAISPSLAIFPIVVPVCMPRSSAEFLTVDLKQTLNVLQTLCDEEGVFVATGHVVQTPTVRSLSDLLKTEACVAGVRTAGLYIAGTHQQEALDALISELDSIMREVLRREVILGLTHKDMALDIMLEELVHRCEKMSVN